MQASVIEHGTKNNQAGLCDPLRACPLVRLSACPLVRCPLARLLVASLYFIARDTHQAETFHALARGRSARLVLVQCWEQRRLRRRHENSLDKS